MKKLFTLFAAVALLCAVGCGGDEYDDSALRKDLADLANRVAKLEQLCQQMNTNISSLQTIVNALQQNDYITSVAPVTQGGKVIGYTITFSRSGAITIYHGEDGKDGTNGKDGYTPQVGVMKDTDGIYYWTVDGEWLLDFNGDKIKAVNEDGKNGMDGITPQLKIASDFWYVSYDGGVTWSKLGKATGEDGDSILAHVTKDDEYVYFTLTSGEIITVPLASGSLVKALQSVVFVPRYTDEKATLTYYEGDGNIVAELDYAVLPVSMASTLAEHSDLLLSMKAIETASRSITFIPMPILSCEVDTKTGVITVKASGKYLNPNVFEDALIYKVALTVDDGVKSLATDYVELVTKTSTESSEQNVETPSDPEEIYGDNHTIVYSTSDHAPVQLAEITGFGGVLLSNIYDVETDRGLLTFSEPVICIPKDAFRNSTIKTIHIPDSVTEIGETAFYACDLIEITIPKSITKFRKASFSNCSKLEHVDINASCSIGVGAFNNCRELKSVLIGNSVIGIGEEAFRDCWGLTELTIGSSVEIIGQGAFLWDGALTKVTIPNSVKVIEDYAFAVSTIAGSVSGHLKSVFMGNKVTSISRNAFAGQPIEQVYINDLRSWCNITYTMPTPGHYRDALYGESYELYLNGNLLTDLVIPEGVKSVNAHTFCNLDQIESVSFPEGLEIVGGYAFYSCTNIKEITLPNSLLALGSYAFANCNNIIKAAIGTDVEQINDHAFYNCVNLQTFVCKAPIPPILGGEVFHGDNTYPIGTRLYVPIGVVDNYMLANGWRDYVTYIKGYTF